ncbi:MAG: hypothetical protein ABSE99_13255 [Terracidiphilus sp.]|jgi:hypothetical protein
MPTLDDVYQKFGMVSEAAQLLETELGTLLFDFGIVQEGLLMPSPEANRARAAEMLDGINRQTLGQLIRSTKRRTDALDRLEPLIGAALEERNRLAHQFYRQHNLRRNSDGGRSIMLDDLESIHDTLIKAYKAVMLLSGTDLDALVKESMAHENEGGSSGDEGPTTHLPI